MSQSALMCLPCTATDRHWLGLQCRRGAQATYLWGGLVRIDVLAAPESCSLTFYTPGSMLVTALPLQEGGSGSALHGDAFGAASAEAQGGLRVAKQVGSTLPAQIITERWHCLKPFQVEITE